MLLNVPAVEMALAAATKDMSKWSAAMDIVAEATDSQKAVLIAVPQLTVLRGRINGSLGPTSEGAVINGWHRCHLNEQRISELSRKAVIGNFDCRKSAECGAGALHQDLFQNLWAVNKADTAHSRERLFECEALPWFAGIRIIANDELWCLVLERSADQGPFSKAQLKRLEHVSSMLSLAATEIHTRGLAKADGILSAFEILEIPAALVDRHCQLMQMNQAAQSLLQDDDVTSCRGKIVCSSRAADLDLSQKLREFMCASEPPSFMPFVVIQRGDNEHPLLVSAIRLDAVSQDVFARYEAILTFTDLDRLPNISQENIRGVFGLTPAEARLAAGLTSSKSLDALATELNVTKETARHQLKSVFAKLGVHRQSELIALLSRTAHH